MLFLFLSNENFEIEPQIRKRLCPSTSLLFITPLLLYHSTLYKLSYNQHRQINHAQKKISKSNNPTLRYCMKYVLRSALNDSVYVTYGVLFKIC